MAGEMRKQKMQRAVQLDCLVTARTEEIKSIVKILEDCDHGRRAFQTLPRHMQRRQVSSNAKRLPRYLREQHMRENKNGSKIVRRPSRKYRRRPRNLLTEYNRRQKEHVWLETHLWHAKRFHMIRRWGYALPDSPTCKGYRATLRAAKSTCLAQDISYMCCIELEGNLFTLLSGLDRITQPDDYALLSHPNVQKGQQWEEVTFFKPDMQPYGALGNVDIMWHASESFSDETSKIAKLWIWVHPSAHNHIVETLVGVYGLEKVKNMEIVSHLNQKIEFGNGIGSGNNITGLNQSGGLMTAAVKTECDSVGREKIEEKDSLNGGKKRKNEEDSSQIGKKLKNVNTMKLANKNVPFERTPKYYGNSSQISMTLLKDTLSRFRLTGPEVLNVLKAAIIPANLAPDNVDENSTSGNETMKSRHWWKDYFSNRMRSSGHQDHVDAWKKLSYSQLGKRMILPLTIRDPRTTLPKKKTPIKSEKDTVKAAKNLDWPIVCPLYESAIRDKVSLSKEPDDKINKRRAKLLTPGSDLPEIPEEFKVPVLMLSRPQTHSIGYGKGIDLIVCCGWGMSVWLPIVLNGGVAGGQQAAENLYMEFLTPQTPNSLPDTPAGDYYSALIAHERRKEFFKRPPTCRRNLIKLGIQYPFAEPWLKLIQSWVVGIENVYALRNPKTLKYLAELFGDAFEMLKRDHRNEGQAEDAIPDEDSVESWDLTLTEGSDTLQACNIVSKPLNPTKALKEFIPEKVLQISKLGCLVKVKIILEDKGSLEPCAMVCLPREEDIKDKRKSSIKEPPHKDTQEDERKKFKLDHEKTKRKIRTMKTNAKLQVEKKMSEVGLSQSGKSYRKLVEVALEDQKENNEALYEKHASYNSCMEELWLMKRDIPLQCCSRKIMGYVTHGTFSMTLGRGAGIGWIALKPLLDCLLMYKKSSSTPGPVVCSVLVRNPSSLHYYWGKLYIVK